jgi:hypothetical protein
MDNGELYKVIRSQIEHIDNTISQRIVWLVISQSFFFSGYSVLTTGSPMDEGLIGKQHLLITLFPIAAFIMNLISLVDIVSGMIYLKKLARDFRNKNEEKPDLPYPPIDGFQMLNRLKNLSALILPAAFLVIWVIILAG